jgi:hypothetical protein
MLSRPRRLAVLLLASLLCITLAASTVRAGLEQALLSHAAALLDLPAAWQHAPPRSLAVNGAHIEIATGRSELALTALLDHVQASCRTLSGNLELPLGSSATAPLPGFSDGVLRAENDREGVVACLRLGRGTLSGAALVARLARFSESLDLADLGGVSVVRARAHRHGSSFVVAASHGAVPLGAMFPARGDAPGVDPREPLRPHRSRRVLSVHQLEREPALFIYESERSADELWADYTRKLAARGWSPADERVLQSAPHHAALFVRGAHIAVVLLERRSRHSRLVLLLGSAPRTDKSAQPVARRADSPVEPRRAGP